MQLYKGLQRQMLWTSLRNFISLLTVPSKVYADPTNITDLLPAFCTWSSTFLSRFSTVFSSNLCLTCFFRGFVDYENTISAYWPEFGVNGKDKVTVRELLSEQVQLFTW